MRTTRSFHCMTEECENYAVTWITLVEENRNKHVCLDCRNYLTTEEGWILLNWGPSR